MDFYEVIDIEEDDGARFLCVVGGDVVWLFFCGK
jgi:hypothetical protein